MDDVIEIAIKNNASQKSIIDIFKMSKGNVSKHFTEVRKKLETIVRKLVKFMPLSVLSMFFNKVSSFHYEKEVYKNRV